MAAPCLIFQTYSLLTRVPSNNLANVLGQEVKRLKGSESFVFCMQPRLEEPNQVAHLHQKCVIVNLLRP